MQRIQAALAEPPCPRRARRRRRTRDGAAGVSRGTSPAPRRFLVGAPRWPGAVAAVVLLGGGAVAVELDWASSEEAMTPRRPLAPPLRASAQPDEPVRLAQRRRAAAGLLRRQGSEPPGGRPRARASCVTSGRRLHRRPARRRSSRRSTTGPTTLAASPRSPPRIGPIGTDDRACAPASRPSASPADGRRPSTSPSSTARRQRYSSSRLGRRADGIRRRSRLHHRPSVPCSTGPVSVP